VVRRPDQRNVVITFGGDVTEVMREMIATPGSRPTARKTMYRYVASLTARIRAGDVARTYVSLTACSRRLFQPGGQ
jgi:hypothetical protein